LRNGGMAVLTSHQPLPVPLAARQAGAMKELCCATVRRDLLLALRRKSEVLTAVFFFVIVTSLFPLGIGPEPVLLKKIAPGVLWVAALLATCWACRACLQPTMDGTLEQMALSPSPLGLLVAGKILAHWLLCGLPLVLLAPVLGMQFDLDARRAGHADAGAAAGNAAALADRRDRRGADAGRARRRRAAGAAGAAAVHAGADLRCRRGGGAHIAGLDVGGHLSLLAAMLALAAFFAPWATTAALRIALE
jgi:heme exporter protein B